MNEDKSQRLSLSQLIGDVRRAAVELVYAEMDVLGSEVREKISATRTPVVWLSVATVALLSALALGVTALFLLMVERGLRPSIAAAILCGVFLALGLFTLRYGMARMRGLRIVPARIVSRLRDDAEAVKGSWRNA